MLDQRGSMHAGGGVDLCWTKIKSKMKTKFLKLVNIRLESVGENKWFEEGFGKQFLRLEEYDPLAHHVIDFRAVENNPFLQVKINSWLGLNSSEWDIIEIFPFRPRSISDRAK